MKSINEITSMLSSEIEGHIDNIKSGNQNLVNYNEILGDTSFLLAGLLESLLEQYFNNWDQQKWIDDSLITSVLMQKRQLTIKGIMIWGREDTTNQWTDLFSFEVELPNDKIGLEKFIFRYCDVEIYEVPYEQFRKNRDCFNGSCNKWQYEIYSNDGLISIF
jgi:hypothetical protein